MRTPSQDSQLCMSLSGSGVPIPTQAHPSSRFCQSNAPFLSSLPQCIHCPQSLRLHNQLQAIPLPSTRCPEQAPENSLWHTWTPASYSQRYSHLLSQGPARCFQTPTLRGLKHTQSSSPSGLHHKVSTAPTLTSPAVSVHFAGFCSA